MVGRGCDSHTGRVPGEGRWERDTWRVTRSGHEPRRRTDAIYVADPVTGAQAELHQVQPYAAQKAYRCPGCNQEIAAGTAHVVVVPLSEPAGRRHWHSPCWEHRHTRRPGR